MRRLPHERSSMYISHIPTSIIPNCLSATGYLASMAAACFVANISNSAVPASIEYSSSGLFQSPSCVPNCQKASYATLESWSTVCCQGISASACLPGKGDPYSSSTIGFPADFPATLCCWIYLLPHEYGYPHWLGYRCRVP